MPVSEKKPKQFSFIMSASEHQMLQELAEHDNRSAANWLRNVIATLHDEMRREQTRNATAAKAAAQASRMAKGRTRGMTAAEIAGLNALIPKRRSK